jgi:hypothetical protein
MKRVEPTVEPIEVEPTQKLSWRKIRSSLNAEPIEVESMQDQIKSFTQN